MAANWRWCGEVKTSEEIALFSEYFKAGTFDGMYPHKHPDYQPEKATEFDIDVTRSNSGPADPWRDPAAEAAERAERRDAQQTQTSTGYPHDSGS